MANVKNNLRATVAPAVTDDVDAGYTEGSLWSSGTQLWQCKNPAAGAAVWRLLVGLRGAWPATERLLPANFVGATNSVLATTVDKIIFLPFEIDREVAIRGGLVYVSATSAAEAQVDLGLYANNPATDRPGARLARAVGLDVASSTGTKYGDFASPVTVGPGLYWGAVGIKGVASPAAMTRIGQSNGKHLGGGTLNDMGGPSPWRHLGSTSYTYASGLPDTAPTVGAENVNDSILLALRRS